MKHIGFTGTRKGITVKQFDELVLYLSELRDAGAEFFHHGDAIGADATAHEIAVEHGYKVIIHPPTNDQYRAYCGNYYEIRDTYPYLTRDQHIVNESAVVLACPYENFQVRRSGTWATVRRAWNAPNTKCEILWPTGEHNE